MNKIFTTVAVSIMSATACYSLPLLAADTVEKVKSENQAITISQDKQRLIEKLALISQFSADFNQQVIAEDGTNLMPSSGTLAVKKPNLVFWQTQSPDETTIVSDGDTLWFYDPFVEQATAYSVNDSIANTPILLLTSTDMSQWQNYQVSQISSDSFAITSLLPDSRITSLDLTFTPNTAKLSSFAFTDATGQKSVITLSNFDSKTSIPASQFVFTVPEGIDVDDQR